MLVGVHQQRVAFFLGNGDRADFTRQVPGLDGRHGPQLAVHGHQVLGFALNLVVGGHVLGRLGHGVHAVFFFHQLVDEAPADGGVVHRVGAAESGFGFGHHEGRTAHAFHAAGNHQACFARFDGACRRAHCIQARAAQPVDRGPRHIQGQTGQQAAHVSHVAVVLTGLVGAAIQHIGDGRPVHAGVAGHQGLDGNGAQIVGAHTAQSAAVAAEGGADGITNKGLVHEILLVDNLRLCTALLKTMFVASSVKSMPSIKRIL